MCVILLRLPRKPAASPSGRFPFSHQMPMKAPPEAFPCVKAVSVGDYPIWNFLTAFFMPKEPSQQAYPISRTPLAGIGGRIRCTLIPIRCADKRHPPARQHSLLPPGDLLPGYPYSLPDMHKVPLLPAFFSNIKAFPISAAGLPHRWYIPLYQ